MSMIGVIRGRGGRRKSRSVLHRALVEVLESRQMFAASLIAAYSFDEAAGTTVHDLSGNGNNGTISGATWTSAGKFGSALSFNGTSSLVSVNDSASLHLTSGMTVEAWVNAAALTSPGANWCAVVAKEHLNSGNDISYALYAATGSNTAPAGHILIGSTDRGTSGGAVLALNTWAFLATTYDGTTLRTYVNGTQIATKSVTGAIVSTTDPLTIGGDWSNEMFKGSVDNVRIYNGALTAAQVQSDMNAPIAPAGPAVTGQTPAPNATNVPELSPVSFTFNESVVASSISFSLKDALGNPVSGALAYTDATHTASFTPSAVLSPGVKYTATVSAAKDSTGNSLSAPVTWSFTTIVPVVTSETPVPGAAGVARNVDPSATFNESIQQASLTFTLTGPNSSSLPGTVAYNDATHTATFTPSAPLSASSSYTAALSGATDAGGAVIAPATWTFTTAAAVLPAVTTESPTLNALNVSPNTTLSATFNEPIQPSSLSLTLVDASNNPVNGVVAYNAGTQTATFTPSAALLPDANYTVTVSGATDLVGDVMAAPLMWSFSTASAAPSPLTVTSETPAPNATGVSIQTAVTATFSEAIQPATLNFVLRDQKTNPVAATVTYNAATLTATLTPTSPLVPGMAYNAIVSDAQDLSGNVLDHASWVFTAQQPGTGPFSIFTVSTTPASPNDSDASATEVGVKFRTDVAGTITGIRFYKGNLNTGSHVGHLWTSSGTMLASATFTNESASGWQQVNFAAPIAIQANTTYVASYHTTSGHYSEDDNYFTSAGVDNAPLHALKAGVDGYNGVYLNTASTSAFPTQNYQSANYYVDVVFDSGTTLGPTATGETPAPGSANASVSVAPTITFNESVVASSISFVLRDSANNPVPGTVSYNDPTHTATFTPTAALNPSTSYTAVVSGATDAGGGMVMASPVTWSFTTAAPAADPSVVGQWSAVQNWPLVAINQILLNNGQVLMYDGGPACIGSSSATVYNPANGTFTSVPVDNSQDNNDLFCSGAVVLADGRVVVVGGHDCTGTYTGIASLNVYNPATQTWTRGPNMAYRRWYPTATLLPDGRVLVTAGADKTDTTLVPIPEVYNPVTNAWSQLTSASQTINNYPFMFVLPNGNVLEAGSDEAPLPTKELNLVTNTWTTIDPNAVDGSSAVMYRPGMILKAGASCPEEGEVLNQASSANAYVLDMTQANPQWKQVQSMANARTWLDLTMLPDGNVLATGGSRTIGGVDPATAVYPAEQWNPTTQQWTTLASMATPRMYHSTALLLPDGRVLVAGGGHNYVNNNDYYSAEYYSPAYLFKGARPTITSSPTGDVQYSSSFTIQTPDAANIASVCLIHTGAVTHAFDEAQSYVPLSFTQQSGSLTIQSPADPNLAVPGYYMLFIVNKQGVPSVATFVHLPIGNADTQPPSQPGTLAATSGYGPVTLTWGAATDNVGVVQYDVYRSTTAGFTPSAGNQIGTTTGLSYSDSGLSAGTYYYAVAAQDAAGNIGPASNLAIANVLIDTVAPTVALIAPISGATVSGTIALTASASDNVAVAGVQFQLDGINLGAEVTTTPYSINWASTSAANGNHTLTAIAFDSSGNKAVSAPVGITVSNAVAGLVAAYNFDQGSGSTLTDVSGNGNNGSIANAAWVAGKFGGGLQFNGTNSLVTVANSASLNLTAGMTLEAWVNPSSLNSPDAGWAAVIAKEHLNSSNDISYALYGAQGTNTPPGGNILVGSATYGTTGGSNLPLNGWTFLAATYDGTTLKTFVNGVLVSSQSVGGNIFSTGDPLTIGGDWSNEMFTGIIDNVRIYKNPLSQTQIQQDMNTPL